MDFNERLASLFIAENEIPEAFRIDEVRQEYFLLNGTMRKWDGPFQDVLSPVYIKTDKGLQKKKIGSYPVCTEAEAAQALEA
ncbi:MAG TPA: hypothetical protein VK183_12055, partial [Flavobacterium sp.]|nr:hypothetical protein [Flavobacterium sp.]